jgi:H+/gluconate symporter-like permease
MGPVAAEATEQIASAVVQEAIDEALGTSHKKWALVLVAFLVGAVVAAFVARQRQESTSLETELQ